MATAAGALASDTAVDRIEVSAYEISTDGPDGKESDGTLEWSSTTVVVVQLHAGDAVGTGWTYGPRAVATLVEEKLAGSVVGADPLAVRKLWLELGSQLRNAGRPGVGAMAVSAVDTALWDPIDPDARDGYTARADMLKPSDVAEAVLFAATRPAHVHVDWLRLGPA